MTNLFACVTFAATITLTATDTGFVTSAGGSSKFDGLVSLATYNYSVGWETICLTGGLCPSTGPFGYGEKKNYFVFDAGTIGAPIVGATLTLSMPTGGYTSTDSTETFIISRTGVPLTDIDKLKEPTIPAEITPAHIDAAARVYGGITDEFDLFGTALGTSTLSTADEGSPVSITLGPAGVGYINDTIGAGGILIFGGKVASQTASASGPTEEVFSFSDSLSPTVTIALTTAPVPVPAALWLFISGVIGLLLTCRKSPSSA